MLRAGMVSPAESLPPQWALWPNLKLRAQTWHWPEGEQSHTAILCSFFTTFCSTELLVQENPHDPYQHQALNSALKQIWICPVTQNLIVL